MKHRLVPLIALSLALVTAAFAQDHDRPDDRNRPHGEQRREGPPPRPMADERGAGPDHAFRRGGRLPTEYRNRQYVVDDWRGHHLSAPPRGYHWVQTGADYVLVAVATGIIANVLLGH